jgi:alpha-amylase
VSITKTILVGSERLAPTLDVEVAVEHRGDAVIDTRFALEFSLHALGGGGNPSAWYDVGGARSAHDGSGEATGVTRLGYGNDWVGVSVEAVAEPAADAWWSPIETVSNSESGFERVYQGSALLVSWPVRLQPGETRRFAVRQAVAIARDRAHAEVLARA